MYLRLIFSCFLICSVNGAIEGMRRLKYANGEPVQRIISVEGVRYREYKVLVPNVHGTFDMQVELVSLDPPQKPQTRKFPDEFWTRPPDRVKNPLDIRSQWYAPGGQPEFPKLVFSLSYGWKEVFDAEEFKSLRVKQTAPWGLPGLRWIEVPFREDMPEKRTRVAIPSAFVPVGIDEAAMQRDRVKRDADDVVIPFNHPKPDPVESDGDLIELDDLDDVSLPTPAPTIPKSFVFDNKTTPTTTTTTTTTPTSATTGAGTTAAETAAELPSTSEPLSNAQTVLSEEELMTDTSTTTLPKTTTTKYEAKIIGKLVAGHTDTCKPILVRGEDSEPLYWIMRAQPCKENANESAKVFVTDDCQAFAYYGRPELASLKDL